MSRGHGAMELYILAALTHRNEMTAAMLAGAHPSVMHELPSRSLRSSLNRALRNLQASGRIVRLNRDGIDGWSLCDSAGDRLRTGYHEAAHAVVAVMLGVGVKHATIKPGPDTAGHVLHDPVQYDWLAGIISFAGKYGESLLLADDPRHPWHVSVRVRNHGASADHKNVRRSVIRHIGHPTGDGRYDFDRREYRAHRRRLEKEAKQLVLEYRDAIKRVAEALIDRETLTGAEIYALVW